MERNIKIPARPGGVLTQQAFIISLCNRVQQVGTLVIKFAAYINVATVRAHRETGDQRALQQLMRLVSQNVAVLACARLGFIGIDHQVMRAAIGLLGHERPLHPGRESRAAAPAQTGLFHLFDNPVTALGQDVLRIVPVAALLRRHEVMRLPAIEIYKYAVFIIKH